MAILYFLPIFSFFLLLSLPYQNAFSTRNLDSLLQDYAFKALSSPKTGLPNNLTGVQVSAMKLTSGVQNYKEFQIPIEFIEKPYVKRLVLVYQNLGNFSEKFYPLPNGFSYLTPVLGLLSYSSVDLSATELPGLDNNNKPILIKFSDVKSVPYGSVPKCVYFDLDGSVHFDSVLDGNVCKTMKLGHFSIVVESSNKESSVIHLQSWKKKNKNKNKKKTKKMNKNLEAGIIAALCLIGLCIVLILVCCWLLN
ncbi:hypothetical protein P8452_28288 [Trifolium repens]|jgi:hypothetical protein|nr:hypothetical protein P8452_28288 [Trifolium repens]